MFSRVPEEVCEVRLIDLAAAEKAHCMIPKVEYPQCRRPRMLQAPKKAVPSRAGSGLPDGASRGGGAIPAKTTVMAKAGQR